MDWIFLWDFLVVLESSRYILAGHDAIFLIFNSSRCLNTSLSGPNRGI
jgi:hypothetical protein